MRNMLLEAGAFESEQEKSRWELRQLTDIGERARMQNYKNIMEKE